MEKKVQNRLVFQHNSHIMHGYISKFGLTNLTALMIETKTIQRNSNIWVLLFSHWIMMMTRQLWLYEKKKKRLNENMTLQYFSVPCDDSTQSFLIRNNQQGETKKKDLTVSHEVLSAALVWHQQPPKVEAAVPQTVEARDQRRGRIFHFSHALHNRHPLINWGINAADSADIALSMNEHRGQNGHKVRDEMGLAPWGPTSNR